MKSLFTVTCVVLATLLACLALAVGLDQYAHGKFDEMGSLNYRGYRGAVVGAKQPGEHRIGVFGGSVAMGYGVPPAQSIAGHLERQLNQANAQQFTVLNLAATGDAGASSFAENYQAFDYLELDTLAFLLFEEGISCRVDTTSVRDWRLFVDMLLRHHEVLGRYVMDAASVRSSADAYNAVGERRERLMSAFNGALLSPYVVDASLFADVQQRYLVGDASRDFKAQVIENDLLACLTNLLVLQATAGRAYEPAGVIDQLGPSRRTRNPIFSRFNYWFILAEVGWEKYFLLRYGDISEGYVKDRIRYWIEAVRKPVMNPLGERTPAPQAAAATSATMTDFVNQVTGLGKPVYFLLFPFEHRDQNAAARMYLDYVSERNKAVHTVDLGPLAAADVRGDFSLDGLHFSALGNQLAADALLNSMRRAGRAD